MPTNLRLIGALAAALLFAGCATTPGVVQPKTDKSNMTAATDHVCTGSRIPTTNCASEIQRYSSAELNSTGITPSSDGLGQISSNLTIHH
jgi:uncharacterized lipoprotein